MPENTKMTLTDLLAHLNQQLLRYLGPEEGREDKEELYRLASILFELRDAAEHYRDVELDELIDDMLYVATETLMGARFKGESYIDGISERIEVRQRMGK